MKLLDEYYQEANTLKLFRRVELEDSPKGITTIANLYGTCMGFIPDDLFEQRYNKITKKQMKQILNQERYYND